MPRKCSCGKTPSFNLPGGKPLCCSKCKTPEMVDVKNKKCPCGQIPIFNIPGQSNGIRCSKCRTDEMVDVVNKKCPCGNRQIFNIPGQKNGICCLKCKTDEMVDVVSNRCPCGKRPAFNLPGETVGVCCVKCKDREMVAVVYKRCPCGKRPVFNVLGETTGICCSGCKTPEMIDVVSKRCPGYNGECPVRTYIRNNHEYCLSCDPNDSRRKKFKLFEEAFFEYVNEKLNVHQREFRVTFDQNETSKKFARVDGIVFGDCIVVCLEVDENGHREYECDEHRMHLVTAELLQKYLIGTIL